VLVTEASCRWQISVRPRLSQQEVFKPDGAPRKLMGASVIRGLDWSPKIGLEQGGADTYDWFPCTIVRHQAR